MDERIRKAFCLEDGSWEYGKETNHGWNSKPIWFQAVGKVGRERGRGSR